MGPRRLKVFTFGHDYTASTRFRFKTFEPDLETKFTVISTRRRPNLATLAGDRRFDAIYLQKALPRLPWWWGMNLLGKRPHIVYDFDDAIWERSGKPRSWWARKRLDLRIKACWRYSEIVTTSSEYLAEFARPYARQTVVIPITVPEPAQTMTSSDRLLNRPCIGWSGHPQGHYLIESIGPMLDRLREGPFEPEILVLSGRRPNLSTPFEWLEWSPQNEEVYFDRVTIGVVPLSDGKLEMGKSPVKIIQHLARGIPVITNGRGATQEITRGGGVVSIDGASDSWINALTNIMNGRSEYLRLSSDAMKNYQENFSSDIVRSQFLAAFDLPDELE